MPNERDVASRVNQWGSSIDDLLLNAYRSYFGGDDYSRFDSFDVRKMLEEAMQREREQREGIIESPPAILESRYTERLKEKRRKKEDARRRFKEAETTGEKMRVLFEPTTPWGEAVTNTVLDMFAPDAEKYGQKKSEKKRDRVEPPPRLSQYSRSAGGHSPDTVDERVTAPPITLGQAADYYDLPYAPDPMFSDPEKDIFLAGISPEKLAAIREQAHAAGRLGADRFDSNIVAKEYADRGGSWVPQEMQYGGYAPQKMGGTFTTAEMTPEVAARIKGNEEYFAPENVARRAALDEISNAKDPRSMMYMIETLRQQRKDDMIQRILEAGRSPETGMYRVPAAQTLMAAGIPLDPSQIEKSSQQTKQYLQDATSALAQTIQRMASGDADYSPELKNKISLLAQKIQLRWAALDKGSINPELVYREIENDLQSLQSEMIPPPRPNSVIYKQESVP